ncbi:hypothetical protein EJ04DRAFT_86504 [Polyplosphaeria fusca]|uniref:Uncharacterized protein n=1 Tax=Polyplosphaeria fusca TaxID=682080 RepID=A0A9P4V607_9PLEO|nr:hypothetical protein EJ04DRAFT_86504 [Polyplosphaeria fusca]
MCRLARTPLRRRAFKLTVGTTRAAALSRAIFYRRRQARPWYVLQTIYVRSDRMASRLTNRGGKVWGLDDTVFPKGDLQLRTGD